MHTLKIKDLTVSVENKTILKDFNIEIKSGEIHAIMGPNGTGKSTLSKVIMGDSNYKIEKGSIYFDEKELNELPTDERARLGIFLGYQMPPEVEGVSNSDFLRTAMRSKNDEFKLYDFIKKINNTVDQLNMDKQMIHRGINEGFSGGERKKNEILQMYMLEPNTIILDEIDSGLDVDSLRVVGENVMKYYKENKPSILLITHYQRLLDYIKPDYVHIMKDGHIIKTGNKDLVREIEKYGYDDEKLGTNVVEEN
jgi:Fe-S cluster assembly ATP-binding protein